MKSRTKTHQKMTKCISRFKKKQKTKLKKKTETLTFLSVVIFFFKSELYKKWKSTYLVLWLTNMSDI